jgi:glucose/arabinose dehydrogenase/chitodextrinase
MYHALLTPRFAHRSIRPLAAALVALAAVMAMLALPARAPAVGLPPGYEASAAFSGLTQPIALQFSSDGRVFVAEKSGIIKVFDGLGDTTPTTFADLRTQVHNYWDRGVEGMALHPNFPATPYVYVYYVADAPVGGTAPTWGTAGATSDNCPDPPGGTGDGCVVSGRISRLTASGNTMTGPEQVLVSDWCQQYPSHAGGGIAFGADGYLYFTGGEGAAWHFADYGQDGSPTNPCGDPPGGAGVQQTIPTAQGGRFRAQDLRTPGDPVGLSGSLIRIDPITGAAAPGNPLAGNADPNARRMLAYGLRNPFRMAIRPGTNDVYVADVGGGYWEEIDRVQAGTDPVRNFGWPCYEGGTHADGSTYAKKLASWDAMNLDMCENLYADGTSAAPYWAYEHDVALTDTDNCDPGGNSISGIEFYPNSGGSFPASFQGSLFFADYSRECIWVMKKGTNGLPDPTKIEMFANLGIYPVDLKVGPNGDLFFVDIGFGQIRRITYTGSENRAPVAHIQASPTYGPAPLEVGFDASGSTDADGDTLTYAWDLDDDGQYDDSTEAFPRQTYAAGPHEVGLKVTDAHGAFHSDTVTINSGETPPSVSIDSPTAALNWHVGQTINFSGSATDEQDGTLPASALSWKLILNHCVTVDACHSHPVQDFAGVSSGSFVAPDHGYPSHLMLEVTATDSKGLKDTKSIRLDPQTVNLTLSSSPANLNVTVDERTAPAPLAYEAIVGATTTISAESPQTVGSTYYGFASWSDGKAQSHEITAPSIDSTYTATFDQLTKLTFTPVADARVEEATPTTAYGTQNKLRVDGGADPDIESYLRFNVSGVTDGTVVAAKLRLSSLTDTIDGPTLRSAGNTWTESSVNWSTRPTAGATVIDDREAISANSPVEYNVKPLVGGDGTITFGLLPASSDGLDFASREYADTTKRPVLELLVSNGDQQAPTAPTNLDGHAVDARRIDLSWTPATDNRGVTNYEIYRDGSLLATTGNVTGYSDTTVGSQTTYQYTVKALDAAGNRSPASNATLVTTPAAPLTTLTFTPIADARVEDGSPSSNFGSSTKLQVSGGVPKRESYLRFQLAGITGPVVDAKLKMTSTTDGTKDGPALYGAGGGWNETELAWSNRPSHNASPADDIAAIPKGTVANYNATSLVNANGTLNLALISTFNDNVDLGSREHADTAVRPQLIVTFDTSSSDTTAPSAPGTLTADAPTHSRVDLSWGAATDNVGVTGYEILRDGTPIATVGAVTNYTDTTVSPLAHYDYAVKALDAAGNRSTPSNTAGVNTPAPPATSTVTFDVAADARVESGAPDTNFGTSSKLRTTNAPPAMESWLKFSLTGITGTVQSAKLRVFDSNDATNNGPAVYRAGSSWTESGLTWNNRPARTGGPSDNKVQIAIGAWAEYDVAPLVTGSGDVTFVLVGDSTDGANFASKEYTDPSKKAQLEVTFSN